jgi:hypothetical protein
MQLAFLGKDGLARPEGSSKKAMCSAGNVVETVLGMCAALRNDHITLSVARGQSGFPSPDEAFTPFAEALCKLAIHLYRIGCSLEYSVAHPGAYAETYCDQFGSGAARLSMVSYCASGATVHGRMRPRAMARLRLEPLRRKKQLLKRVLAQQMAPSTQWGMMARRQPRPRRSPCCCWTMRLRPHRCCRRRRTGRGP